MKRITMLVLVCAMLFGLSSYLRAQESVNDFTLVNKTGYILSHVYVSPTKTDDWGEDVMGKDVVGIDEEILIKFNPKSYKGLWDLKVTYSEDNSSAVWSGYDLSTINKIIIRYDKVKDVTTAETE